MVSHDAPQSNPGKPGMLHRPRRSACADASLEAELERLRAMTVVERIEAALGLGRKFADLRPTPVPPRQP